MKKKIILELIVTITLLFKTVSNIKPNYYNKAIKSNNKITALYFFIYQSPKKNINISNRRF